MKWLLFTFTFTFIYIYSSIPCLTSGSAEHLQTGPCLRSYVGWIAIRMCPSICLSPPQVTPVWHTHHTHTHTHTHIQSKITAVPRLRPNRMKFDHIFVSKISKKKKKQAPAAHQIFWKKQDLPLVRRFVCKYETTWVVYVVPPNPKFHFAAYKMCT